MTFHGFKVIAVLFLNYVLLNNLSSSDFTQYSVAVSILTVATAFDFGLGQYVISKIILDPQKNYLYVLKEAVTALIPLAGLAGVFILIEFQNDNNSYNILMSMIIFLRIILIPFSAILNAYNQYKIRKIVEFIIYLGLIIFYIIIIHLKFQIEFMVFTLNLLLLTGSIILFFITKKLNKFSITDFIKIKSEYSYVSYYKSFPYALSILVGLLTYGGFIWISKYIVTELDLQKIVIMQTFIMIPACQIYEVALNSRQADLAAKFSINDKLALSLLGMFAIPCLVLLANYLFQFQITKFALNFIDLILFSFFVSFEVGFIFIKTVIQVREGLQKHQNKLLLFKLILTVISMIVAYNYSAISLHNYLYFLIISGLIAYIVALLFYYLQTHQKFSYINNNFKKL